MLSIGSFLLGAGMTTGFEIDDDALNVINVKHIILKICIIILSFFLFS